MSQLKTKRRTETKDYITVTQGMSGYFAVHVWWNPDPGFWEPYQTGVGRYRSIEEAMREAKSWAADEGLEFRL
jgi:hypothetical protein